MQYVEGISILIKSFLETDLQLTCFVIYIEKMLNISSMTV